MSLASKFKQIFPPHIQDRGDGYHRQDRVRIQQGSETFVQARVRGTRVYETEIYWGHGELLLQCDCRYFLDRGAPCKHLWAVIRASDQQGYLTAAATPGPVRVDGDNFEEDDEYDGPHEEDGEDPVAPSRVSARDQKLPGTSLASWKMSLNEVSPSSIPAVSQWPSVQQILYVVNVSRNVGRTGLVLSLRSRTRKANGDFTRLKPLAINPAQIPYLPLAEDVEILSVIAAGFNPDYGYSYYDRISESRPLPPALAALLVPLVARTGRFFLQLETDSEILTPLEWDDNSSWNFHIEVRRGDSTGYAAQGFLRRAEQQMELEFPALVLPGLVFTKDCVAPLAKEAPFKWIQAFRTQGPLRFSENERDEFLATILRAPDLPPLVVPDEMRYEEVSPQPTPHLKISKAPYYFGAERLRAELSYAYAGSMVPAGDPARGYFEAASRRFLRRDASLEKAAGAFLEEAGVKRLPPTCDDPEPAWEVAPSKLSRIVRTLVNAGWHVEAHGKIIRSPGRSRVEVSSGVDWFELRGNVEYGNSLAHLPELLEALRRGDNMVRLDDGTFGLLPEEWLGRIGILAGMGAPENGHFRFRKSQAALLDALLAEQSEFQCDETFARVRQELFSFQGIEPALQPAGFAGQLRQYQCEGLGWMHFLRRFSLGGCLADDMGVGKTAQVLALLESRRELRTAGEAVGPSLVVVPKSLVFNWKQEAERFTPQLRLLDHTGLARNFADFAACDVVLTTYGTLRRDILSLKEFEFDYVVLDEAQTAKNSGTATSKAARLLRGRHRLALSGTPIENHLGELWTLLEFLNPGMLGAASAFQLAGGAMRNPDEATRRVLGQALRPFILRRTKEQVARELPLKTEQTVYCEMPSAQQKLYDELRDHYRESLLKKIEKQGLAKSKFQVLEALLRLRQAACHPGLLNPNHSGDASAKLDMLLERLREILEEGHKALVFSQFTSLLKIVRERLDRGGITYEYLDGATRDRQARVEHFQNDEKCSLFLISLKAGGLGLNLTAAEYVFILDPWWNPAVEAQAVDRAHRIGQLRPVFAYRLITQNTVEEKVLELQKTKRDLAASIIGGENSMIRDLRPEDLSFLLS